MTSKTFTPGTVVDSPWLNDVNTGIYTTLPSKLSKTDTAPQTIVSQLLIGQDTVLPTNGYSIGTPSTGGAMELRGDSTSTNRGWRLGMRDGGTGYTPHLTYFDSDNEIKAYAPLDVTGKIVASGAITGSNIGIGNNEGNRAALDIGTSNGTLVDRDIRIGYNADYYGYRLVNTNNATNTAAGLFKIQRGTTLAWADVMSIDDKSNVTIAGNVSVTGAITAANTAAQTWQNVTASRTLGTTYTNNTGATIFVSITGGSNGTLVHTLTVDGVAAQIAATNPNATTAWVGVPVPNGSTYSMSNTFALVNWAELR